MKQAAHEATVLPYSLGIDPFLEDLAKGADRVSTSKEGRETPKLTAIVAENERSEDFGGILEIWSSKRCLVGPRVAHYVINLRILESETTKEILAEIFDTEKAA